MTAPELVVLHYTAMTSAEAARDWLCNPQSEVSCHYVIGEDGRLWQLVSEEHRAWHAGAGSWGGRDDVNSRSIGIELANTGAHPFPEPQMAVLEEVLNGVLERWRMPPEAVIGHSDMALGRKIDPGGRFDWRRLALKGLAVWPEGRAEAGGPFGEDCRRFGYDWAPEREESVLKAVRMRFRPWATTGPLDGVDRAIMAEMAARFPCRAGSESG